MEEHFKRIGISGGTFDPIHYGHLIIAEHVRECFKLEKVIFIPSGMPPHKDLSRVTPAEHRFNMTNIAISTNRYFEASRIELERKGYTYTVDTLQQLRDMYGNEVELYFIIGADVVPDLLKWKDFKRVFELCEFVAVLRPWHDAEEFKFEIKHLQAEYGAKINIMRAPLIEISSTEIRERVMNGSSIKYLVPEGVESYIADNGLYRSVKV